MKIKRNIMLSAWELVKSLGITISEALVKSWAAYKLRVELLKGETRFVFRKVNGELREALGTLNTELFNYTPSANNNRKRNYGAMPYFDLEKGFFRSFKIESLVTTL